MNMQHSRNRERTSSELAIIGDEGDAEDVRYSVNRPAKDWATLRISAKPVSLLAILSSALDSQ
jgi:hypothetical protein